MNKDFFMNKRMRQIVGEEIDNVMKNDSKASMQAHFKMKN